jgi:transcriptional regulator with XRE-family HTH domain
MDDRSQITGAQVRMARAFLRWSVAKLARKAKVGISSVQRIEAAEGSPIITDDLEWRAAARAEVIAAVHDTLVRARIKFLPDDGNGEGVRGKR